MTARSLIGTNRYPILGMRRSSGHRMMRGMFRQHTPTDPKTAALRSVGILRGLSDREVAELSPHVDEVNIPAGSPLMLQGAVGHEAFLVVDGTADIVVDGEVVGTVGRGDLVGEMALIDHESRTATVVADTRHEAALDQPAELRRLRSKPEVSGAITRLLVERLRAADFRQQAHWTPA